MEESGTVLASGNLATAQRTVTGLLGQFGLLQVEQEDALAILTDVGLPGRALEEPDFPISLDQELRVVVMTAWSTVEVAIAALQQGAADFIEKPWENSRLLAILRSQTELGGALREQRRRRAAGQREVEDAADALIAEVSL